MAGDAEVTELTAYLTAQRSRYDELRDQVRGLRLLLPIFFQAQARLHETPSSQSRKKLERVAELEAECERLESVAVSNADEVQKEGRELERLAAGVREVEERFERHVSIIRCALLTTPQRARSNPTCRPACLSLSLSRSLARSDMST